MSELLGPGDYRCSCGRTFTMREADTAAAQRDQAMAWNKRQAEEFTAKLAEVVTSTEAELILARADAKTAREQRAAALREAAEVLRGQVQHAASQNTGRRRAAYGAKRYAEWLSARADQEANQ